MESQQCENDDDDAKANHNNLTENCNQNDNWAVKLLQWTFAQKIKLS